MSYKWNQTVKKKKEREEKAPKQNSIHPHHYQMIFSATHRERPKLCVVPAHFHVCLTLR
jgi:hypothetical protein